MTRIRDRQREGKWLGRAILMGVWLLCIAIAVPAGLELYLKAKAALAAEPEVVTHPIFEQLRTDYLPFTVQHINPYYLFFFPYDRQQRVGMNNSTCSIDAEGFRGPGPGEADGRKLAFFLGGSAAFGHYASSNATTITGYMNRMQTTYHFVNGGVPSWNSLQELFRLNYQILEYDPDLVIAYDGGNDMALAFNYWRTDPDTYLPGTPESFDELYALVGDIRAGRIHAPKKPLYERLFPRVTTGLRSHLKAPSDHPRKHKPMPKPDIKNAADKYVFNLNLMNDLAHDFNADFVAVYQPIRRLHRNVDPKFRDELRTPAYATFLQSVETNPDVGFDSLDLTRIFDEYFEHVPCFDKGTRNDLNEDTIFVDGGHLYDRGNRIVAREVLNELGLTEGEKTIESLVR